MAAKVFRLFLVEFKLSSSLVHVAKQLHLLGPSQNKFILEVMGVKQ